MIAISCGLLIAIFCALAITRVQKNILDKSLIRNNDILNTMFEGLLVVDGTGKIVDVNTALCKIFGYQENELKGVSIELLIESSIHSKHQDWLKNFLTKPNEYGRLMGDSRNINGLHKAGHLIPIKIMIGKGGTPNTPLLYATISDNSEKHQIQSELAVKTQLLIESEERYNLAIEGAGVGIWDWFDVNGSDLFWSDHFLALLGYKPGELEVTHEVFAGIIHPDDVKKTWQAIEDHFIKKTPYDIEYRFRCKNGEYKWFRGTGKATFDENDKPLRMVGSVEDINTKKENEGVLSQYTRELERSNQELNEFAYVASHDLKAPLRGIMQLASWIREDLADQMNEQIGEYLDLMQNRIARLEKLLDDLLAYSRVGRKYGDFSEVNVTQMAQELFELLNPPTAFKLVCAENLPRFITLSIPFELILRNLINNAIKHHHQKHGIIKISGKVIDSGYQFIVCDDGPGIEPQFHDKIFGIFQTLKPRDEVEGSGMGLAIVKKLIDAYHCNISIESDGKSGTCVIFTWPNEEIIRKLIHEQTRL